MFLSTYENKLDKKGRVSVPASFRSNLSNMGYNGVICYPSFNHHCIEAWPQDRIEKISDAIDNLNPFEEKKDYFATSILSDVISTDIQKYLGRDVEALILKLKDPSIVNQQVKLLTNLVDDLQTFAQGGTPEAFSEAVMEVLHQVRSFGDEAIDFQAGWQTPYGEKAVGTKMTADLKNSLDMLNDVVSKWVPDDWVIQANARGRLGFYRKGNRAHYADRKVTGIGSPTVGGKADGLINLGKHGYMDESTMLHEINHRFQKNNEIQLMLEKVAVDKRVAASAPDKQKLTRIYLSLIHISEPTRPERIGVGGVWV